MTQFDRITFDSNIMGGRACIRNMRITVSLILNLVSNVSKSDLGEVPASTGERG